MSSTKITRLKTGLVMLPTTPTTPLRSGYAAQMLFGCPPQKKISGASTRLLTRILMSLRHSPCDQSANTAAKPCHPIRCRPASARSSAPSAQLASSTCWATFVQIAAAASRLALSAPLEIGRTATTWASSLPAQLRSTSPSIRRSTLAFARNFARSLPRSVERTRGP